MAKSKSGIILGEGENLVMELEAELWASSQNPIAKLIGTAIRLINLVLGFKRRGYLVITDQRVVEVVEFISLWVFTTGKNIKYVLPSSVKEVGYTKEGTCFGCFCQAYNLYYDSFTQRTSILLPVSSEAETKKVVDAFYAAISKNQ